MRGIRRSSSAPSPTCGTIRNGEPVDHGDGPPLPKPARITSVSATPYPVALAGCSRDLGPVQRCCGRKRPARLRVEFRRWKRRDGAFLPPTYKTSGKYAARLRVSNEAGTDARTVTIRVARHARQEQEARNRPARTKRLRGTWKPKSQVGFSVSMSPASSTGPCPLAAALPDGTAKPPHFLWFVAEGLLLLR